MQKKKSVLQTVFYILFFFLLCFLAFFPSWHRIKTTPQGLTYMVDNGLMADYYFYLSVIKQGHTRWNYINQYTTEPTYTDKIHILYILLGKIGRITGIDDISIYWLSIACLLCVSYIGAVVIIRRVIPKQFQSFALLIIFLTGPLPPYRLALFGQTLYEGSAWWTQLDVYRRLTFAPHNYFGQAFIVWAAAFFLKFLSEKKIMWALACAFCILLTNIVYIIPSLVCIVSMLIFIAVCTIHEILLARTKNSIDIFHLLKRFFSPYLPGLLCIFVVFVGSYAYVSRFVVIGETKSVLLSWEYQIRREETYPNLISVLILSLGIIPLFVIPACISIGKRFRHDILFLLCLFFTPFILYFASVLGFLPISKFRFTHTSLYVFGGICAAFGAGELIMHARHKIFRIVLLFLSGCLIVWNITTTLWYYWIPMIQRSYTYYNNLHLSQPVIEALTYLKKTSPPFSHVLSTFFTGMYIPVFTDNIVYLGSEVSTSDFQKKSFRAGRFFNGEMTELEVKQLVADGGITYIFWENRTMLPPHYAPLFTVLFSNSEITIYKTRG